MTADLRTQTGWDLVRDTLADESLTRSLYAILAKLIKDEDEMLAAQIDLAASASAVISLTQVPAYNAIFVFTTQACKVELVSGEDIDLPAGGYMLASVSGMAYLKFTNGTTAGSVVYVVAG